VIIHLFPSENTAKRNTEPHILLPSEKGELSTVGTGMECIFHSRRNGMIAFYSCWNGMKVFPAGME
jgi:hypothetical protein